MFAKPTWYEESWDLRELWKGWEVKNWQRKQMLKNEGNEDRNYDGG